MTEEPPTASTRAERKKEATRRKVVDAAMTLFREQGFDAATMEEIAAAADIAKGTLYHYFPVKEAILDEYIKRSFSGRYAEMTAQLQRLPDTAARITWLLDELMRGIQAQPMIFEKYFAYRIRQMIALKLDETVKSGLHNIEAEIIRLGRESGELRADLPFSLLTALFEFAFIETAQQFYADPEHYNGETIVRQCVDLFLNGTRNNKIEER